jgi:hypothetical protein
MVNILLRDWEIILHWMQRQVILDFRKIKALIFTERS